MDALQTSQLWTQESPKESVLGSILFLAYINDLPEYLTNGSSANLFADESILYGRISNTDDARKLQQDQENLQIWEKDWQMEFHPKKCQVLNIKKEQNVKHSYTIHSHVLETVKSVKYLGVNIKCQLNWNMHVTKFSSKANSTLSFLQRNLQKKPSSQKRTRV